VTFHWYGTPHVLRPGAEVFSLARPFLLEAFAASHSQLLLFSPRGDDGQPGPDTRVDVLFTPVRAMKVREWYDSLTVRCADAAQTAAVLAEHPGLTLHDDDHVFLIDGGGHVIAMAVGYHEDQRPNLKTSAFAERWVDPDGPPWRRPPLSGLNRGLHHQAPTPDEFAAALDAPPVPVAARNKVGSLFVVMLRFDETTDATAVGAFVTRSEAEEFLAAEAVRAPARRWIESVPVTV
jgi:hypothetical protein